MTHDLANETACPCHTCTVPNTPTHDTPGEALEVLRAKWRAEDTLTLADDLRDVAREKQRAGMGHMTWAECTVWLRQQVRRVIDEREDEA